MGRLEDCGMMRGALVVVLLVSISACTARQPEPEPAPGSGPITKPLVSPEEAYDRCRMAGDSASLVIIRHNDGPVEYSLSGGAGAARIARCMANLGVKDLGFAVAD